jgi:hypothetical protein
VVPPHAGQEDRVTGLKFAGIRRLQRFPESRKPLEIRVREVHEGLKSIGISNAVFFMNEASHLALAGQLDNSMDYLDRAMDLGFTTHTRMKLEWPALEPLEGNPRFEAIQVRMIEHLNSERAKLGLEPMST